MIKVGGASEVEVKERKDRVDDALHATRAAVEEGIVPGGGTALLYATKALEGLKGANDDQTRGIDIVRKALTTLVRQIARTPAMTARWSRASCSTATTRRMGFNAQTDTTRTSSTAGVIDPTKVVRTALQNAASVAGLLITTEAAVSEMPEDKPAMPHGRRRHGRHGRHGLLIAVGRSQGSARHEIRTAGGSAKPNRSTSQHRLCRCPGQAQGSADRSAGPLFVGSPDVHSRRRILRHTDPGTCMTDLTRREALTAAALATLATAVPAWPSRRQRAARCGSWPSSTPTTTRGMPRARARPRPCQGWPSTRGVSARAPARSRRR